MESLELLSEVVIDTLKEFSTKKLPLTPETLRQALSHRKEIPPLLARGPNGSSPESATLGAGLTDGPSNHAERSQTLNAESLSKFQGILARIFERLGPMIRGNPEKRYTELQQSITNCQSLAALGELGGQIDDLFESVVNQAIENLERSNDFLVELSKDLYKMEEQLGAYQNHNRETFQLSSEFNNNILSQTKDIGKVFDSSESLDDTRLIITSKIHTISKAIEIKCQTDEVRLREADSKIAELQKNVRTYNQEITEARERADALEKEVLLDALTEVDNRRSYDLHMQGTLRQFHQNGELFSLILIDIDHFKEINDHYGHHNGDKCLHEIAKLIKSTLRKTDFLARYGGEELVAVLHGSNADNAAKVAEKVRVRIERALFLYQAQQIPITVSVGATEVLPDDRDPEAVFVRVDQAMYRAKSLGRNQVCAL